MKRRKLILLVADWLAGYEQQEYDDPAVTPFLSPAEEETEQEDFRRVWRSEAAHLVELLDSEGYLLKRRRRI